jgi:hypothetical protein
VDKPGVADGFVYLDDVVGEQALVAVSLGLGGRRSRHGQSRRQKRQCGAERGDPRSRAFHDVFHYRFLSGAVPRGARHGVGLNWIGGLRS